MATIIHAVIGYFVLLLTVRVLKRRAGSQISMVDFVLIFLIGGAVILATVGPDRSMTNCVCAVVTVAMLHRIVAFAKSKNPHIGALIDGVPIVVFEKGSLRDEAMRKMRLLRQDIEIAARSNQIPSLEQVDYAIVERNGTISVIPHEE